MVRLVQERLDGDADKDIAAIDASTLKANELVRLVEAGSRLERVSRGVPDAITEQRLAAADMSPGAMSRLIFGTPRLLQQALDLIDEAAEASFQADRPVTGLCPLPAKAQLRTTNPPPEGTISPTLRERLPAYGRYEQLHEVVGVRTLVERASVAGIQDGIADGGRFQVKHSKLVTNLRNGINTLEGRSL